MTTIVMQGDVRTALRGLPDGCVQCVVTSPPYFGLRSYLPAGHADKDKEVGSEPSPTEYLDGMVSVFREVRRVLREDGVVWLNLGDSYATSPPGNAPNTTALSSTLPNSVENQEMRRSAQAIVNKAKVGAKPKDLFLLPARLALALQADGWWIRQQLPWLKRSCMPESVKDRPANAVEYVYLLSKSAKPYYDTEAVRRQAATKPGTRGAKASKERSEVAGVNSRPPEYHTYGDTRHFRNSDLFFDSLEKPYGLISNEDGEPLALDVNTFAFPAAHFATFGPKLVEPLILAGTSEHGRCNVCGAPFRRIIEKRDSGRTQKMADGWDTGPGGHGTVHRDGSREKGEAGVPVMVNVTIGWQPTCVHTDAKPIPCLVLDPFGGSGTVGLAANRLGRDAILYDLNPEYVAMAEERIEADEIKRGVG